MLSLYLALLCRAMHDRKEFKHDLKNFSLPRSVDGTYNFACNMLPGLAMFSYVETAWRILKEKNIPEDIIRASLSIFDKPVTLFMNKNDGAKGYDHFVWNQHYLDGEIFLLGGLEYQINIEFCAKASVFKDKNGNTMALADGIDAHRSGMVLGSKNFEDTKDSFAASIREYDDRFEGYPIREDGTVSKNQMILSKSIWDKVLQNGDSVVSVHIPHKTDLSPASVDDSFKQARAFLKTYFPQYNYKAFICTSWLMDPQLGYLLKENSNIAAFNKRFNKVTDLSFGEGVLKFVFFTDSSAELNKLPENTSLQKILKNHYVNGRVIYEFIGYIYIN